MYIPGGEVEKKIDWFPGGMQNVGGKALIFNGGGGVCERMCKLSGNSIGIIVESTGNTG